MSLYEGGIKDQIATHDAKADGVYLVQIFEKEKFIQHAIFSQFATAKAWIDSLPTKYTCMAAPFLLDKPDLDIIKEKVN